MANSRKLGNLGGGMKRGLGLVSLQAELSNEHVFAFGVSGFLMAVMYLNLASLHLFLVKHDDRFHAVRVCLCF